jgi:integrase/recombinase XerD
MSSLRQAVEDYLSLRRSLGFKLRCTGALLRKFAAFAEAKGADYVTVSLALEWATCPPAQKPALWADRMKAVRVFARHQHALDPRTEVPPYGLLPYRPPRARPYLYTEDEIRRLLEATARLRSTKGIRPHTYYCLLGLLAVSGLRISEALALRQPEVDLQAGILTIRKTKFKKSRLIPLHPSTVDALRHYAEQRHSLLPTCAATPSWSPISGALWKSPLSAGPSTNSLAGSVCGRERSTAARVSTTFDIDSPSRR